MENIILAQESSIYRITLLFRQPPLLDAAALHEELQNTFGQVQLLNEGKALHTFMYLDILSGFGVPVSTIIAPHTWTYAPESHGQALQQSMIWPDAKTVVPQCSHAIRITDMMASTLEPMARLLWLHQVVQAILALLPCDAIYWEMAEQFVDPATYQEVWQGSEPRPLYGAVNVRLFNVANRLPGETIMDSVGLSILGLPDVQCHFVDLDLNEMARMLYNVAGYLLENGDVIQDGETVPGFTPDSRWHCHHEESLAIPKREVLDIDPGSPHNAGRSS